MSKYKVIKCFTDLQDNNYAYHVGNTYPREGIDPKPSRIAELSSTSNRRGVPLIERVEDNKVEAKVIKNNVKSVKVDTTEETKNIEEKPTQIKKDGTPKKKGKKNVK